MKIAIVATIVLLLLASGAYGHAHDASRYLVPNQFWVRVAAGLVVLAASVALIAALVFVASQ